MVYTHDCSLREQAQLRPPLERRFSSRSGPDLTEDNLAVAFLRWDKSGSGKVSSNALDAVLRKEFCVSISDEELHALHIELLGLSQSDRKLSPLDGDVAYEPILNLLRADNRSALNEYRPKASESMILDVISLCLQVSVWALILISVVQSLVYFPFLLFLLCVFYLSYCYVRVLDCSAGLLRSCYRFSVARSTVLQPFLHGGSCRTFRRSYILSIGWRVRIMLIYDFIFFWLIWFA